MTSGISANPEAIVVLIDTWWNVNLYQNGTMRIKQTSFNRYMVECELSYNLIFLSTDRF